MDVWMLSCSVSPSASLIFHVEPTDITHTVHSTPCCTWVRDILLLLLHSGQAADRREGKDGDLEKRNKWNKDFRSRVAWAEGVKTAHIKQHTNTG